MSQSQTIERTAASAEPRTESLDKKTNKVSADSKTNKVPAPTDTEFRANRRRQYQLREFLRGITKVARCTKCGHVIVEHVPTVHLMQARSGQARFSGVMACNSLWLCPVCSERIARKRGKALNEDLARWGFAGGGLGHQTFTIPHHIGDSLKSTVGAVTRAFRGLLSGRAWHRIEREFGIEGHVRFLEVTVGPNGWHPHLHVLFFTERLLSSERFFKLGQALYERFSKALSRRGVPVPDPRNCPLIRANNTGVGAYVAKVSAAAELTSWHTKLGRQGNRSPFQVLLDASQSAKPGDLSLWREWELVMPGRRQMTWSKGFVKKLRALPMPVEAPEPAEPREPGEEDPEDEQEEVEELRTLARISQTLWSRIRSRRGLDVAVLEAAESGGYDGAAHVLRLAVGKDLADFEQVHFTRDVLYPLAYAP